MIKLFPYSRKKLKTEKKEDGLKKDMCAEKQRQWHNSHYQICEKRMKGHM